MQAKCPACSTLLNIPDHLAGKPVKCQCGKVTKFSTPRKQPEVSRTPNTPVAKKAIRVNCPKCHKALSIPEALRGKAVKCQCGAPLNVPVGLQRPEDTPKQSGSGESDFFGDLGEIQVSEFKQIGPKEVYRRPEPENAAAENKPKRSQTADLLNQANNQLAADSFHYGNVQTSGRGEMLYIIGHGFMCVVWTAVIGTWCGCISPFILGMIARHFYSRDNDTLAYLYFSMAILNLFLPLIMMFAFRGFFDFLLNLAG